MQIIITNRDQFMEAVAAIYEPSNTPEQIRAADRALNKLNESKEAWDIANLVLTQDIGNAVAALTASSILKNKTRSYFHELQKNHLVPYFNFLADTLKNNAGLNRGTRYNLIEAMIIVYMRLYTQAPNLMEYLVKQFDVDHGKKLTLEFFIQLPNCAYDSKVVMEDEQKKLFVEYMLKDVQTNVFQLLHKLSLEVLNSEVSAPDLKMFQDVKQYFETFGQWMIEGTQKSIIADFHQHATLTLAFKFLIYVEVSYEASLMFEDLLVLCDDPEEHTELYKFMLFQMIETSEKFTATLAERLPEEIEAFLTILTEILRPMVVHLLEPDSQTKLVTLLTFVISILNQNGGEKQGDAASTITSVVKQLGKTKIKNSEKAPLVEKFVEDNLPLFSQLIEDVVKQMKYSPMAFQKAQVTELTDEQHQAVKEMGLTEEDEALYEDNEKQKEEDRKLMRRLFEKLTGLISFSFVMGKLAGFVQASMNKLSNNPQDIQSWTVFEASLFAINGCMTTASVTDSNRKVVVDIVQFIIGINTDKNLINRLVLRILAKASSFIKNDEQLISSSFRVIAKHQSNQELKHWASEAVNRLCKSSPSFVVQNIEDFVQYYSTTYDEDDIVEGLAIASNILTEPNRKTEVIKMLVKPFAGQLIEVSEEPQQESKSDRKARIKKSIYLLKKIILVIEQLEVVDGDNKEAPPHCLGPIFQELFPVILKMLSFSYIEPLLVEKLCKVVKVTMKCLKFQFQEFCMLYFQKMISNYKENPISTYLYAVENAVTVFYKYREYDQMLSEIFEVMINRTFELLPDFSSFEANPDIVDDFFGLMARFIRFVPHIYIASSSLEKQLQMSIIGIGVTEQGAGKALYQLSQEFFTLFIEKKINPQPMYNLLVEKNYGQQIVTNILIKFYERYPYSSEVVEYKIELLMQIISALKDQSVAWFTEALKNVPLDVLSDGEKNSFIENLMTRPLLVEGTRHPENETYYDDFFKKYVRRSKVHNDRIIDQQITFLSSKSGVDQTLKNHTPKQSIITNKNFNLLILLKNLLFLLLEQNKITIQVRILVFYNSMMKVQKPFAVTLSGFQDFL